MKNKTITFSGSEPSPNRNNKVLYLYKDNNYMNKKQWQIQNGFTDEEMTMLTEIVEIFNGKIVKISNTPPQPFQERELQ